MSFLSTLDQFSSYAASFPLHCIPAQSSDSLCKKFEDPQDCRLHGCDSPNCYVFFQVFSVAKLVWIPLSLLNYREDTSAWSVALYED